MERLEELKKEIEGVEIGYDLESAYCDLINATIDYQNDTQDWRFEDIFSDYIDNEILEYSIQHNLKEYGVWAVRNLLEDIKEDNGIYRIDAYGYGHDITSEDLEIIKDYLTKIEESIKEIKEEF